MSSPLPITLITATTPQHYSQISALENHVFYDDPFTIVAFGPERDSPANIELRAKGLAKQPEKEGERCVVVMAVMGEDRKEDGNENKEIAGAAQWRFVTGREAEENRKAGDEMKSDGGETTEKESAQSGGKEKQKRDEYEEEDEQDTGNGWGIGANVKFCEDVFLVADEHMLRSTKGRDYASECLPDQFTLSRSESKRI
ncbi:hypothetical protein ONS96_002973 [Cadophora gregata f. sp. sojae]|nr:hypothetical protein ONS96_002973 [Cadophora gregata f. sp. sojae]